MEGLQGWLKIVHSSTEGSDRISEDVSMEYLVLCVGSRLFSLEKPSLSDIHRQFSEFFDSRIVELISTDIVICAEACLLHAVSSACLERSFFVQCILQLGQEEQASLMFAIQNNMERHLEDKMSPEKCMRSAAFIAENAVIPPTEVCSSCLDKEKVISQLTRDKLAGAQREQDTESKLKAEVASVLTRLVDCEVQVLEREKQLSQSTALLSDATSRLQAMEEASSMAREKLGMLESLMDEVDVLRPLAAKADAAERQLIKLRDKLDELTEVRQQLKNESKAHADTHNKLLDAEVELEQLRKSKLQLDEYRQLQAEANITINELRLRLDQKDAVVSKLNEQVEALSAGSQCQLSQTHFLSAELQAASERLRVVERFGSVGEGMSELNPALMQELQRLRSDNKELQSKLNSSSLEHLDKLSQELADSKCMCTSLQSKWMHSSDQLDLARTTISNLRADLYICQSQFSALSSEMRETDEMMVEDRLSATMRFEWRQSVLVKSFDAKTALLVVGREALAAQWRSDLQSVEHDLQVVSEEMASLQAVKSELEGANTKLTALLEEERAAANEHRLSLIREKDEQEERLSALVAEEQERGRSLQSAIEEEKTKRRRLEREKKLMESEVHRHKTQLQCAGGGGSQEVDSALKELKQMQQQLDAAQAEIKELRLRRPSEVEERRADPTTSTQDSVSVGSSRISMRSSRVKAAPEANPVLGLLEHSEYVDKRMEQLQKEKREMIARNLEENKEKIELNQKLMLSEREVAALKSRVTRLTLEKERLERRMAKGAVAGPEGDTENVHNIAERRETNQLSI